MEKNRNKNIVRTLAGSFAGQVEQLKANADALNDTMQAFLHAADENTKALAFESAVEADTYASMYRSMLYHPAYTTLNNRQKILYVYCKENAEIGRIPKEDYPELQDKPYFYMSISEAVETKLYTLNMKKDFYSDMRILEEHGLIKLVIRNKVARRKNVYAFSADWQNYTKAPAAGTGGGVDA